MVYPDDSQVIYYDKTESEYVQQYENIPQNSGGEQGRRKNAPKIFLKYMKKKLALTFFLVALALFGLAVAVAVIGQRDGADYSRTVLAQQTYTSDIIPFKRGEITDRNGTVLATNEAVYNLILDPSVITSDENILNPLWTRWWNAMAMTGLNLKLCLMKIPTRSTSVMKEG